MENLNWNPKTDDIYALQEKLEKIQEKCDNPDIDFNYQKVTDVVDFSDLPSAQDVHEKIAAYPIWSIDMYGDCLVGDAADSVESLESILEYYKEEK